MNEVPLGNEGIKKYFYLGEWEYHIVEKNMPPGMTDGED